MPKSDVIDDPTCVIKMLDNFRSRNPNLIENRPSALLPTRLQFNDSVLETDVKKRKFSDSFSSSLNSEIDEAPVEVPVSPWTTRNLKAELLNVKAKNASLEYQIEKLQGLRKEMELLFENEKASLLKQQEWDKEKIQSLEEHMETLRIREKECKEELSVCKQTMENNKFNYEKKILHLQKENTRMENELKELETVSHERSTTGDRIISELEAELTLSSEEIAALKNNRKTLEGKAEELLHVKHQLELIEQQLSESKSRIKELEMEQENEKEARELVEKQQQNLKLIPDLEQEITTLREENKNLRDAVHNKLVLEEEVIDLRARQAGFEEREEQLAQLHAAKIHLESMLEQWHKLARDHCVGVPSEKAIEGPELLRIRIETLQQKELLFIADVANLESRLKSIQKAKETIDEELEKKTKLLEKLQTVSEQQSNFIKRLQKKLLLVSRERDSYRMQLDMYEKDLTISSSASAASLQQQQQRSRIEALEKAVEGYRELVERLESDQEKFCKVPSGNQLSERIQKLEEERDALRQEKEQLQKRRDELELELEYRVLKGDFNPMKSKVLHFRMNPAAESETQRTSEMMRLQEECDRLRERLRLIEEGLTQDVTEAVNTRLSACSTQELQDLREQVKSYEKKNQRLTEAYKATMQEFRDLCYMLLGYKIDKVKSNLYRLSSMYAETQDDHLLFKLTDGSPGLLETPYSQTIGELINLHLIHQHSIPVFLSAITLDLFNRQTMSLTDATDEPVVLD